MVKLEVENIDFGTFADYVRIWLHDNGKHLVGVFTREEMDDLVEQYDKIKKNIEKKKIIKSKRK